MIKKLLLLSCFFVSLLNTIAQPNLDSSLGRTCATPIPSQEWDNWFNTLVEQRKADLANGKVSAGPPWQIPVIVHIIHNGQPVGTADNISQAQVLDQLNIVNADFAGTGFNSGLTPPPFVAVKANMQISFCLAVKNPTGGTLPEAGIDRIDRNAKGWTAGPYGQAYIDANIKPTTIWDPTRYCNIWVIQLNAGAILGYATFPANTALVGITGGGTATTDGVVILNTAFGSIGSATAPPYNKGRTLAHELGHWLGLRHIWGDGAAQCTASDFCNDTPPARGGTAPPAGANYGCPTYPFQANMCTFGGFSNTNGDMFMNFMDYTDDACLYMFTNDQKTRAQTAMTQGTYRSLLGTHGLCNLVNPAPGPAVASFDIPGKPCIGQAFIPNNTSNGTAPTYSWSSTPNASIVTSTAPSPAITFTAAGNYILTLTVTNTINTSTFSLLIPNVAKCPVCLDTIRIIKNTDTLKTYKASTNSLLLACQTASATGFLTGTNCYQDKEFAQYYPAGSYSDTPSPQVSDVIVLFDSIGTKATTFSTQIYCKLYGGTSANGPNSFIGQTSANLGSISAALPKLKTIKYCGTPTYTFVNTSIIPYKFTFSSPFTVPTGGFFASVQTPYTSPGDSIRIFGNTQYNTTNDSSAWFLNFANNWRTIRYNRGYKIQLAILPIISCSPVVGIKESTYEFTSNINIMPNPNNGVFSLVFTLPKEEKINIRIYNSLGIELSNNSLENVTNNVVNINISDRPNGIYFVCITNGETKLVKKVIVSN